MAAHLCCRYASRGFLVVTPNKGVWLLKHLPYHTNPFDRLPDELPSLTVALGPALLNQVPDTVLERLREINRFEFVKLTPIATSHGLADRLRSFDLSPLVTELRYEDLRAQDGKRVCRLGFQRTYEYLISEGATPDQAVERLLSEADHLFDIRVIVPDAIDPYRMLSDRWKLTDLEGLFTRLRLLCVTYADFRPFPDRLVPSSRSLYHRFRLFHLFPEYQRSWIVASQPWLGKRPRQVSDQLSSLGRRLEFVCRALDEALIAALRSPGNDSEDEILYQVSMLVFLISGAFDDLAWLITHYYGLGLSGTSVTIRHPKSPLMKAVENANPKLHDFLLREDIRECIECIYPMRDRLQHRDYPQMIASLGTQSRLSSWIAAPVVALEVLSNCTSPPSVPFKRFGLSVDDAYADPYWLIGSLAEALRRVVNGALPQFGWVEQARRRARPEINEALRAFDQSPGVFLDVWGEDPPLFI